MSQTSCRHTVVYIVESPVLTIFTLFESRSLPTPWFSRLILLKFPKKQGFLSDIGWTLSPVLEASLTSDGQDLAPAGMVENVWILSNLKTLSLWIFCYMNCCRNLFNGILPHCRYRSPIGLSRLADELRGMELRRSVLQRKEVLRRRESSEVFRVEPCEQFFGSSSSGRSSSSGGGGGGHCSCSCSWWWERNLLMFSVLFLEIWNEISAAGFVHT